MKFLFLLSLVAVCLVAQFAHGALVEYRQCSGTGCGCSLDPTDKCGNGKCDLDLGENCDTCALDCGACVLCPSKSCGNGVCDAKETGCNCPQDCGCCADGLCLAGETFDNCQSDCAAAIRGKVVDYFDGSPIVGANVTCGPSGQSKFPSILADTLGNFVVSNVSAGLYECIATYGTTISGLYTFTVFAGSNLFPNKTEIISLQVETGILTGTTLYKVGAKPLAGVKVVCRSIFGRREGFSDENAHFFFTGVRPGTWSCEGSAPGFSSVVSLVGVNQASVSTVDVFVDVLRGNIAGSVVNTMSGLNVESSVSCIASGEAFQTNTSRGFFYFPNVLPGSARCVAVPIGPGWIGNSATGVVPAGLNLTLNINVSQVLSNLSGSVINADTGATLFSADVSCSSAAQLRVVLTLSNGTFIINNLAAGNFSCLARRGGFFDNTLQNIVLGANSNLVLPAIALKPIPGRVRVLLSSTLTSLPLNATLNCRDQTGKNVYSGNISGELDLQSVTPGNLTCDASAPTFVNNTAVKVVPPIVSVDFSIQLSPQTGSVSGSLRDSLTSAPLVGVVVACAAINPSVPAFYSATTSGTGAFTLTHVLLGDYTCSAQLKTYNSLDFNFTLASQGQVANATYTLAPVPGRLDGRIVDNVLLTPLGGSLVTCTFFGTTALGSTKRTFTTGPDGLFFFDNILDFGPWRCQVNLTGYSHSTGRGFAAVETKRGVTVSVQISMEPSPGVASISVSELGTNGTFTLASARVTCKPVTGDDTTSTRVFLNANAVGNYTNVRGSYVCTAVLDPTYRQTTTNAFTISPGDYKPVAIEMQAIPGSLLVTVVDRLSPVAVVGARVFCGNAPPVFTSPLGQAVITNLARGTVSCLVTASGFADKNVTAAINNGAQTSIQALMDRARRR
eukprot:TRINITY_DN1132_c0_g4_i2.p1 TRINITY_DN1132_c0_g4~~TRINITY_DN1132_c0_g4_i2.p1  ORF type:complete len:943 (-),score=337.30 TRINITY_DN1132_c0_g4_i2:111-2813(-)